MPSVFLAPILKVPWPPIRQTILVSDLALIGTGAKTSAQRREPFTSASGVCAGNAAQAEARGAENPTSVDGPLGVGVGEPEDDCWAHATVSRATAKHVESP